MKATLLIIIGSILLFTTSASAGIFGLTHHSRAACLNNESISWDKSRAHFLGVSSRHKKGAWWYTLIDNDISGGHLKLYPAGTFDGAKAIHYGEGVQSRWSPFKWRVWGTHAYFLNGNPQQLRLVRTYARNCNIINGWLGS